MTLPLFFQAGRVRRWHSNSDMSWTDDYNDGHQGRVARILLAFHPKPSAQLLAAALTHDDGELRAGDLSRDVKNANPKLREMVREVENDCYCEIWGIKSPSEQMETEGSFKFLNEDERKWLHFADRLDGQMWMRHKAPHLATCVDWMNERNIVLHIAADFGIYDDILRILS